MSTVLCQCANCGENYYGYIEYGLSCDACSGLDDEEEEEDLE